MSLKSVTALLKKSTQLKNVLNKCYDPFGKKVKNWKMSSKNVTALLEHKWKKDVNRDSHIASSPISQSSFFKGIRGLILASSQRKLRGYIEFL